jgi:formiminotetrahydrofolate cyclodeaminase
MTEAISLQQLSVRELADGLASRAAVPGGGSASALSGALAAALVGMVAELTLGRPEYERHADAVERARDEAATLREQLLDLADRDADAYDGVMQARRLPRENDDQKAARARQLKAAMLEAARVPLETARTARAVLDLAVRIAPVGNRNAVSDAGVAAMLAASAVRGAVLNVRINLPYLPVDEPLRTSAAKEIAELEAAAIQRQDEAMASVEMQLERAASS